MRSNQNHRAYLMTYLTSYVPFLIAPMLNALSVSILNRKTFRHMQKINKQKNPTNFTMGIDIGQFKEPNLI